MSANVPKLSEGLAARALSNPAQCLVSEVYVMPWAVDPTTETQKMVGKEMKNLALEYDIPPKSLNVGHWKTQCLVHTPLKIP